MFLTILGAVFILFLIGAVISSLKLYRAVEFQSSFQGDWRFDENDEPIGPGMRDLADAIVGRLGVHVTSVSPIRQHEYYGWGFDAVFEQSTFYNVINPIDQGECYLTVSMDSYVLKKLLMKRPQEAFDRYCNAVSDTLREIPEVSGIKWGTYFR